MIKRNNFSVKADIVLYNGNCLNGLQQIPNNTIKLIITSPPYNIGKSYEHKVLIDDYLNNIFPILKECIRVLSPDGSICWQVGNYINKGEVFPLDILYYPIFKELGLQLRNRIVWYFGHGLHCTKRLSGRYETLMWFTKSDNYIFNLDTIRVPSKYPNKRYFKGTKKGQLSGNPLGKNPSDTWKIITNDWNTGLWNIPNVKHNHPEKTIHPCQFPIELAERCVLAFSNKQDWVLDPFCGVSSSCIAAIKHQRKTMGCDLNTEYIDISKKRINDYLDGNLGYRQLGTAIYNK